MPYEKQVVEYEDRQIVEKAPVKKKKSNILRTKSGRDDLPRSGQNRVLLGGALCLLQERSYIREEDRVRAGGKESQKVRVCPRRNVLMKLCRQIIHYL